MVPFDQFSFSIHMIEVAADKVGIRMGLEKIDHDPDGIRLIGVIRSNPTEDFPLGHLQTFIPGVAHCLVQFVWVIYLAIIYLNIFDL